MQVRGRVSGTTEEARLPWLIREQRVVSASRNDELPSNKLSSRLTFVIFPPPRLASVGVALLLFHLALHDTPSLSPSSPQFRESTLTVRG